MNNLNKSKRLAYALKGRYIIEDIPKDIKRRRKCIKMGITINKEIYVPRDRFYGTGVVVIKDGDKFIPVNGIMKYDIIVREI